MSGIVQSGPYKGQFWMQDDIWRTKPTGFSGWRTVYLEDENLHHAIRDVRVRDLEAE